MVTELGDRLAGGREGGSQQRQIWGSLGQGIWRGPDRVYLQEEQPGGMTRRLKWDPQSRKSVWFPIVCPLPQLQQSLSLRRCCSFARDILIGI